MKLLKRLWDEKPLSLILFSALFIRLFSVLFSKGFGMHDDHFLVIEASQSWVDGFDYNNWLPSSQLVEKPSPTGHSFFYSGIHYFIFRFLKGIGMTDAQHKMYIIRFLHALLSLTIIYWAYKITDKLAGQKQAKMVGIILALLWFMPFMSVRNLVEFVCIPPLMYATWVVIKNWENKRILPYVVAGLCLGLSFSIRFQSIIFAGGFGLALLFSKKIKEAFVTGFFFLVVGAAIQGIVDYYIWGAPFMEFQEYVRYNIANATQYFVQAWYLYLILLLGVLIPPISIFLFFGFFRSWKKHLILFLPSFLFLAFHCYFPNKQERFILPIVPFIIILGYIGWDDYVSKSTYWQNHKRLLRNFWIFFWCFNLLPLLVVSTAFSKKSRVDAMVYIAHQKDVKAIIMEDSNRKNFLMPPLFYLEKWGHVGGITEDISAEKYYTEGYLNTPVDQRPNYVVFIQEKRIDERVAEVKKYFPTLTYETTIEPSFIDALMFWLNPENKNQISYVYKIR
ncbi:MAG: Alg9 family protein mannosyltransferase [Bacteroidetes bacterium]|nr:Alg9 family protein mannosyltransferase [Bacteroidota bacterium]